MIKKSLRIHKEFNRVGGCPLFGQPSSHASVDMTARYTHVALDTKVNIAIFADGDFSFGKMEVLGQSDCLRPSDFKKFCSFHNAPPYCFASILIDTFLQIYQRWNNDTLLRMTPRQIEQKFHQAILRWRP